MVLKVALIQLNLTGRAADNLEAAFTHLGQAAKQGAHLALLPELFPFPWFPATEDAAHFALAEPESGPILSRMREVARATGLTLAVPGYEVSDGRRFNTTYVLAATGATLFRYRKSHIPYHPGWFEKYYYEPGDLGFPVFHLNGLTLGIQTCWDNLFPEGSRILGGKGVHVILAPRGTGDVSRPRWRTALAANALANNCYVVSVNRIGLEGGAYMFGGDSAAFDPDGNVVAECGLEPGVAIAEIDSQVVDRSRAEWPFHYDRRPELYGELVGEASPF
ncbi:MAG: carbon-nitrogen hydrolase family protein [Clostridia bacterium]